MKEFYRKITPTRILEIFLKRVIKDIIVDYNNDISVTFYSGLTYDLQEPSKTGESKGE